MTTNLTAEELEMRAACVQAIRARAGYLAANGYTRNSVEAVRWVAHWLGSDEGLFAICAEYDGKASDVRSKGEEDR